MDILDIFYNYIVPEATNGRINCLSYYNIVFSTVIVEENKSYSCNLVDDDLLIPTLTIKNKSEFDRLLVEYVSLALNFYDNKNFDNDILNNDLYNKENGICKEKVILALLFANATVEDFNNPIEFLKKRIDFIYNDLSCNYSFGYSEVLKGNLSLSVEKDIINNETPFQTIIRLKSEDGYEFIFPKIKFGINDDTVYIYAIQNHIQEENPFTKKVNRTLYKVGEGYDVNDNFESEENLKDITASFLVSLNVLISYLYNLGYRKIVVPSILIERWNAKRISNLLKIKYKKLDNDVASKLMSDQDYLQFNLTNKLIRTFLRLGCHYNNIEVVSLPFEADSCLHIALNNQKVLCNNTLLYKTYQLVTDSMNLNINNSKKKM